VVLQFTRTPLRTIESGFSTVRFGRSLSCGLSSLLDKDVCASESPMPRMSTALNDWRIVLR
jgi:hypothetical protein